MCWFKNERRRRPPKEVNVLATKFVGEQDGPSERDLKAHFVELFRQDPKVHSAYLARAEHGDRTGIHVTLAIRHSGSGDPSLIAKLANVFGEMFGWHEHLDVMFIAEGQEQELQMVCAPFYRR